MFVCCVQTLMLYLNYRYHNNVWSSTTCSKHYLDMFPVEVFFLSKEFFHAETVLNIAII